MASNRMMRREDKRTRLVEKSAKVRAHWVAVLKDPKVGISKKFEALAMLERLPRDTSAVRRTRRCALTGRAHGVMRRFGICRNELRRVGMNGEISGLKKASW